MREFVWLQCRTVIAFISIACPHSALQCSWGDWYTCNHKMVHTICIILYLYPICIFICICIIFVFVSTAITKWYYLYHFVFVTYLYHMCICNIFVHIIFVFVFASTAIRKWYYLYHFVFVSYHISFCILFVSAAIKMVLFVSQNMRGKRYGKLFTWIVSASFTEENLVFPFSCCKSSSVVYTSYAQHGRKLRPL